VQFLLRGTHEVAHPIPCSAVMIASVHAECRDSCYGWNGSPAPSVPRCWWQVPARRLLRRVGLTVRPIKDNGNDRRETRFGLSAEPDA
jgi:hypothetical protein